MEKDLKRTQEKILEHGLEFEIKELGADPATVLEYNRSIHPYVIASKFLVYHDGELIFSKTLSPISSEEGYKEKKIISNWKNIVIRQGQKYIAYVKPNSPELGQWTEFKKKFDSITSESSDV